MTISAVILFVIVLILITIGIVAVTAGRTCSEKGGEEVLKSLYVYLVLFATLMMTIGGSVSIFMAVADIFSPVIHYQTFEEYKQMSNKIYSDSNDYQEIQLTEQEIKAKYDAMIATEKERTMNRAKNTLIKSFGWVIIPFPIFLYYQRRLVKQEA